jgi:hypothetical protein
MRKGQIMQVQEMMYVFIGLFILLGSAIIITSIISGTPDFQQRVCKVLPFLCEDATIGEYRVAKASTDALRCAIDSVVSGTDQCRSTASMTGNVISLIGNFILPVRAQTLLSTTDVECGWKEAGTKYVKAKKVYLEGSENPSPNIYHNCQDYGYSDEGEIVTGDKIASTTIDGTATKLKLGIVCYRCEEGEFDTEKPDKNRCKIQQSDYKCTVNNFWLPETFSSNGIFASAEEHLDAFGDPTFIVYWQKFPPGEEDDWTGRDEWFSTTGKILLISSCIGHMLKPVMKVAGAIFVPVKAGAKGGMGKIVSWAGRKLFKLGDKVDEITDAMVAGTNAKGAVKAAAAVKNNRKIVGYFMETAGNKIDDAVYSFKQLAGPAAEAAGDSADDVANAFSKVASNLDEAADAGYDFMKYLPGPGETGSEITEAIFKKTFGEQAYDVAKKAVINPRFVAYTGVSGVGSYIGAFLDSKFGKIVEQYPNSLVLHASMKSREPAEFENAKAVPVVLDKESFFNKDTPFYLASPCRADLTIEKAIINCKGGYSYSKQSDSVVCLDPDIVEDSLWEKMFGDPVTTQCSIDISDYLLQYLGNNVLASVGEKLKNGEQIPIFETDSKGFTFKEPATGISFHISEASKNIDEVTLQDGTKLEAINDVGDDRPIFGHENVNVQIITSGDLCTYETPTIKVEDEEVALEGEEEEFIYSCRASILTVEGELASRQRCSIESSMGLGLGSLADILDVWYNQYNNAYSGTDTSTQEKYSELVEYMERMNKIVSQNQEFFSEVVGSVLFEGEKYNQLLRKFTATDCLNDAFAEGWEGKSESELIPELKGCVESGIETVQEIYNEECKLAPIFNINFMYLVADKKFNPLSAVVAYKKLGPSHVITYKDNDNSDGILDNIQTTQFGDFVENPDVFYSDTDNDGVIDSYTLKNCYTEGLKVTVNKDNYKDEEHNYCFGTKYDSAISIGSLVLSFATSAAVKATLPVGGIASWVISMGVDCLLGVIEYKANQPSWPG